MSSESYKLEFEHRSVKTDMPFTLEELTEMKRLKRLVNRAFDTSRPPEKEISEEEERQRLEKWVAKEYPETTKEYFTDDVILERLGKNFADWSEHVERKQKFGSGYILRNDPNFYWHIRLRHDGEFEKYLSDDMRREWYASQEIAQASGAILQSAVEVILKIVGNQRLVVEKSFQGKRPDLVCLKGEKPLFFDIKLQSTTKSIRHSTENYSRIINEESPRGGI